MPIQIGHDVKDKFTICSKFFQLMQYKSNYLTDLTMNFHIKVFN